MVTAILSSKRPVTLVDEPEAFLHPPQAFQVGRFLARQASEARQIFVATHSADVLRGILAERSDLSVIRLNRHAHRLSLHRLDPDELKEIVCDPLLSSARVFEGLFYSAAMIVEADADARFYHAVARRRHPELDVHVVNADNKQTVPKIIRHYRRMGIPAAAVVDLDVLNNSGEFSTQCEACFMSEVETAEVVDLQQRIKNSIESSDNQGRISSTLDGIGTLQAQVKALRELANRSTNRSEQDRLLDRIRRECLRLADCAKQWRDVKQSGRSALADDVKECFDELLETCAAHGLFINDAGELEGMLVDVGMPYSTNKREWIQAALKLVQNIEIDDKKNPGRFVSRICQYLLSSV
jgi:hypothetical protein